MFAMKAVEENISFLEYTSPTSMKDPFELPFYTDEKTVVYVTKDQLQVVDYVTKFTGQFLKTLE
jgi:mRNA-degrading endonuclease HigB of HigAB toxin-antitoxin module